MNIVDIGANLTHKSFKKDLAQVIKRAQEVGVKHFIITGLDLRSTQDALDLTFKYDMCSSTAGIHPHNAKTLDEKTLNKIVSIAHNKKVVAIGETGLDFNRNFSTPEQQIKSFEAHLDLAQWLNKPLFLHERDAFDKFVSMLKCYTGELSGVVHCFTGDKDKLKTYLDLGLYIGITGWICDDRRNADLKEAVKYIPLDRMFIETDSPFLIPRCAITSKNHSRNEPMFIVHVLDKIVEIKGLSKNEIINSIENNVKSLFCINV